MTLQARTRRPHTLWLSQWVLAAVLLLAQHAGWVHGLSHLSPAHGDHVHLTTSPDHGHSHGAHDQTQSHAEQVCEECLALAALVHGLLPPQSLVLPLGRPAGSLGFHSPAWQTTSVSLPYQSRAPPRA